MFKFSFLIVCISIICATSYANGLKKEIVDGRAEEIAKWAGSKLNDYAGVTGELFLQKFTSVKNLQENEKVKFELEVDYIVAGSENSKKHCKISVMDIPTENVRLFNNEPSCYDL